MPLPFAQLLRLYLTCLALALGAAGASWPAVAAPPRADAAAVTMATQAYSHEAQSGPSAVLLQSEALNSQADAPRGPSAVPAAPCWPDGLGCAPLWRQAAALAAEAVPVVRAGALAGYFRTRLLRAALSPNAP